MNRGYKEFSNFWRSYDVPDDKFSVSDREIIGYYSVDGDRNYLPNSSRLSYYNPPKPGRVRMDLNQGLESALIAKHNSSGSGRIDHLLKWIELHSEEITSSKPSKWIAPDFVCSTGLLTMLMCTAFHPNDKWIICAAKWRGTIYLCQFKTQDEMDSRAQVPPECFSWGYKFEQYIVSDHPDVEPDTSRPVVESAEFRFILQRRFGTHNVLYSTEVDGVYSKVFLNDPLPLKDLRFVELKTKRMLEYEKQEINFRRFALIKWWAQSYVAGSENILCGFRDGEGIVHELKNYSHDKIVQMCKSYWDPRTCKKYCEKFLGLVAKYATEDCDRTIYKFENVGGGRVIVANESPDSRYAFIPSSFLRQAG